MVQNEKPLLNNPLNNSSNIIVAAIVMMIIGIMILPMPTFLMDVFLVMNITGALVILFVSMYVNKPLQFSVFPSVLLIITLFRLSLNVGTTRLILGKGYAGEIIESFGSFVAGGNYVVGIVIFLVLVLINFVVITKGAGRIAEVSARFTLDAMPGKQMAIDADLNAGLLTSEDAKCRREEIAKEADFYGAMDGASKFVKGDAIAGILILLINIIGGLTIGLAQHDLPLATAAENYIILSVGDGLVAQIPSLLLAISTAIIVTRISSNHDLSEQIGSQIGIKEAWLPSSAVLFLIGMIPGMPNFLFLIASGLSFLIWYYLYKNKINKENEDEILAEDGNGNSISDQAETNNIELDEISDNSQISMQLGYGLIQLVDDNNEGPLISRITGVRKQLSKELGFIVPQVRVRDDLTLDSNTYRIRIGQTIVGEDKIYPNLLLAIPSDNSQTKIEGIDVKDPSFKMDSTWIEKHEVSKAESLGYMVVEPEAVIATHLNQLLNKFSSELIGQDDVQSLLDNLGKTSPQLVSLTVPKIFPLNILTTVLKSLLSERIPISDLRKILEKLSTINNKNLSPYDLAEIVRPTVVGLLIQQIAPLNQALPIITFSGNLEQMILNIANQSGENGLILEPTLIQNIVSSINNATEKLQNENKKPVLITAPAIRKDISLMLRQHIDNIDVLSFTELPDDKKIDVIATISLDQEDKN